MSLNDNPLWQLREPGRVPDFDAIRPEHAEPAIRALIEHSRAALDELLAAQPESPDWETLMEPLEAMDDDLARVWSPISHLFGCRNSPAWREAYQACQPLITAWGLETAQNRPLFEAHRRLADTAGDRLSPARRRALDNTLRAFRHGGAELAELAATQQQQQRERPGDRIEQGVCRRAPLVCKDVVPQRVAKYVHVQRVSTCRQQRRAWRRAGRRCARCG